ncbi:MAG: TIGR03619 family F420-dependent LLM class oxidoreductase [Halioglobus sp.]
MRLGFSIVQVGAAAQVSTIGRLIREAESVGYDSLWVLDRLLFPLQPGERYPASADGELPDAYRRVFDPLALLAYASAITERVSLGTSVLNLPWYNPLLLGRALASIDQLSQGRARLGVGTGWCSQEYTAAGAVWSSRGAALDESLDVLAKLWTTSPIEHQGEFYSIPPSLVELRPVNGAIPVYMAAYTPAAMRRVALRGDGWMPAGIPAPAMQQMFAGMRQMAEEAGRDPAQLEMIVRGNVTLLEKPLGQDRPVFVGNLQEIAADIRAARAAGAHELLFDPQFSPGMDSPDALEACMHTLYELSQT